MRFSKGGIPYIRRNCLDKTRTFFHKESRLVLLGFVDRRANSPLRKLGFSRPRFQKLRLQTFKVVLLAPAVKVERASLGENIALKWSLDLVVLVI